MGIAKERTIEGRQKMTGKQAGIRERNQPHEAVLTSRTRTHRHTHTHQRTVTSYTYTLLELDVLLTLALCIPVISQHGALMTGCAVRCLFDNSREMTEEGQHHEKI